MLFALIVSVGTVGACGTADPQTESTGAGPPGRPAAPPELASFCGPAGDLVQVLQDGPDTSAGAPPEEVATALQEFQARFEPALVAVEQTMPQAVRQDVGTLGRQARYAVATKSEAPLETPEYDSALTRTRVTITRQCALVEVRVTATEYKYEGMPSDVPTGAFVVTLINLGAESHEMDVFQIDDSERRPFKELIALPEGERGRAVTSIVSGPNASPGDVDTMLLKLAPGRYGVACRIAQGTTSAQTGTGPLHATLGETAELTVR